MKVGDKMINTYEKLLKYLSDNQLFICYTSIIDDNDLNIIGMIDNYGLYLVGDTVYYYDMIK